MVTILRWFKENSMKVNPKKFMILGKTLRQSIILNINQIKVEDSRKVVLLGFTINNRLTFKDHIDMLCSTANNKFSYIEKDKKISSSKTLTCFGYKSRFYETIFQNKRNAL